jgi:sortase A
MIPDVRKEPFGSWTRMDNDSVYYRSRSRRRVSRTAIALAGAAMILISIGIIIADATSVGGSSSAAPAHSTRDERLWLTVPKMQRVDNIPIFDANSGNKAKLDSGVVRLKDTGLPWEREANVYIAGHRLGYPRTGSFLVFWDLNELRRGDRVVLRNSEGERYVYRVFDKMVVPPGDVSVKKPIKGKNIVSLQTCTLPNYKDRLLVRAELVSGGTSSLL